MARRAERWVWQYAKNRVGQELQGYDTPEVKFRPFAGVFHRGDQHQVFRSLIQINFYPRDDRQSKQ